MDYVLKLRGGVIAGRSSLEQRDPGTRVAKGRFRTGLGYDLIEPIFALGQSDDAAQRARFERARDALAVELWQGETTFGVTDVSIAPSPGGDLELRVVVPDERFWAKVGVDTVKLQ